MKKVTLYTNSHFKVDEIDPRMFGSFAEHMGRCIYDGIYQPGCKTADKDGIRLDTLEAIKELNVPVIRYPGGNMVSAYRWEDTVGPREERPTYLEPAWHNIDDNSFGLNEFMDWAKRANTTPMIAVNLGTRGAAEAKDIIEYCNHDKGTKFSDLRIKHGWKKPHDVKLWCLGNEMDGPWQIGHKSADEYGSLAAQCAKVMKLVDPSIELVACGSAGCTLPSFGEWDATVLDHCYDLVDYLSMHTYWDNKTKSIADTPEFLALSAGFERQIQDVLAACDYVKAKKKSKKTINLSIDEWNVVYRPHGKNPEEEWTQTPHQIEDVYSLEDALLVGSAIITMLSHADRVKIGCLAQIVNVIAPIMTSDNAVWKQTIFYPFAHASNLTRGGTVIKSTVDAPTYKSKKFGDVSLLDAAVVENKKEHTVTIFAVNKSLTDNFDMSCDLSSFGKCAVKEHIVLNNADVKAQNTEKEPNKVKPAKKTGAAVSAGVLNAKLPAHSWNVITLSVK